MSTLKWRAKDQEMTKAWGTQLTDAHMQQLKELLYEIDVSGLKGNSGTIHDGIESQNTREKPDKPWRLDRQNPPSGFVNLQIQKNGVGNPSSVCGVLVPTLLLDGLGSVKSTDAAKAAASKRRIKALSYAFFGAMMASAASCRDNPGKLKMFEIYGAHEI